ncbi:hypothetical protein [Kumtagia ephedrae]|uniref:Uncharacterized protein n=1 Tax=Kumtagia ephedrae TaxID=2116701 RepID=A0A2P7RMI0_9HYPH|nr:hypothetical protein [Mesorhizobium ephedrae]PSJ51421.1 hypothetical protein C7I84_27515 [Mesorhizobium ephedrae]
MQQIFAVLGYMTALFAFAIIAGLIARRFGWDTELNKWIHPTRQFNGWRKFLERVGGAFSLCLGMSSSRAGAQ